MKKHHNPNSPWSELHLDLLNSVFERLGFADFQRAKSVCSSWYSASRQAVPNNQIHWLILFPENSCMLLNPEEKEKLYKTKDLGVEFSKSVCIATYGNGLFMHDPLYNLYIMNLFTGERIDLPSVESQLGKVKVERIWNRFHICKNMGSETITCKDLDMRFPVFWIDEKTKDYILVWGLDCCCVVYSKKGDTSWNQIPKTSHCANMVYKDHKLYFLSWFGDFKIFDFAREIAHQTFSVVLKWKDFS